MHETREVDATFRPDDENMGVWTGALRQTAAAPVDPDLIGIDEVELDDARVAWDQPIPAVEYPSGVEGLLEVHGETRCRAFWLGGALHRSLG